MVKISSAYSSSQRWGSGLESTALRMLTRPDPSRLGLFFAPAFVCMILCMSVPENMLFVTPGLGSFLFYWMSGYLLSDGEAERMGGNKG